jgi:hypothetical protein
MAHPEGEAAAAPQSVSEKAEVFEDFLFDGEEEDLEADGEIAPEEGDIELEAEEEQAEEASEPEPATAPPVSLNAEEKAVFAQLPKEAQDAWAASETRRNTQVQETTTKAAEAQRTAEARAATADAEAKALYGQQLEQFAAAFAPSPPEPYLAQQNPAQYIAEEAQYRAALAQHDAIMQQVRGIRTEAEQEGDAAFFAQRDNQIKTHPKIANPETRDTYVKGIMDLAQSAGLDPDNIARHATGEEFLALAKVFDRLSVAEEKAAKYDAALSKQMQKVRAAKGKNLRPGAAQPSQRANGDWQRVASAKTKEAKAEAFADYFGL